MIFEKLNKPTEQEWLSLCKLYPDGQWFTVLAHCFRTNQSESKVTKYFQSLRELGLLERESDERRREYRLTEYSYYAYSCYLVFQSELAKFKQVDQVLSEVER